MFLSYIFKHIKRGAVINALFCLLLVLSGALLCISAALWYSAHEAVVNIDDRITTIAVPDMFAINRYANNQVRNSGIPGLDPEYIAGDVLKNIRGTIYESGAVQMDGRRIFNAYSPGISSVAIRAIGFTHIVHVAVYSPQSTAAFIGKCESVTEGLTYNWSEEPDGSHSRRLVRYISAEFSVERSIYLNSAYDTPRSVTVNFWVLNPDGSLPVEAGKRYVLTGHNFYPMRSRTISGRSTASSMNIWYPEIEIREEITGVMNSADELESGLFDFWQKYSGLTEDDFPLDIMIYVPEHDDSDTEYEGFSMFELEGNLEDTLASEQSEYIKNLLNIVEISYNSFPVITTNNMRSLVRFNQLRNFLSSGRMFTAKEAENGAKVCLISGQFAEANGLSVGDRLPLYLYQSELYQMTITAPVGEGAPEASLKYYIPSLYKSGLEMTEPIEFKIIGIYDALTLESGDYSISNNTVIIPDKSFDGVGESMSEIYMDSGIPPLLSDAVIIPNGKIAETKAAIDGVLDGYSAFLRFYDQGYLNVLSALLNLRLGMIWILAFAMAGWLVAILMFALFFIARKRQEAALLHAIGVSAKKRFRWVFVQCAVLILLAQGIAFGAGLPLYGVILNNAASTVESFTDSFRDPAFSDQQDAGVRSKLPVDKNPVAFIIIITGKTILLLAASGYISKKAAEFGSLNAGKEGD